MSKIPLLPATYDIMWSGIILLLVVLTIWALVSILRSRLTAPAKLAWTIIVLLLPAIGPICWFVIKSQSTHRQLL